MAHDKNGNIDHLPNDGSPFHTPLLEKVSPPDSLELSMDSLHPDPTLRKLAIKQIEKTLDKTLDKIVLGFNDSRSKFKTHPPIAIKKNLALPLF